MTDHPKDSEPSGPITLRPTESVSPHPVHIRESNPDIPKNAPDWQAHMMQRFDEITTRALDLEESRQRLDKERADQEHRSRGKLAETMGKISADYEWSRRFAQQAAESAARSEKLLSEAESRLTSAFTTGLDSLRTHVEEMFSKQAAEHARERKADEEWRAEVDRWRKVTDRRLAELERAKGG